MFRFVLGITVLGWLSSQAGAQDDKPQPPPPVTAGAAHIVQVTELRANVPLALKTDSTELLAAVEQFQKDGKVDLLETVRIAALDGQEAMAQFGRQTAVTTGTTQSAPGRTVRSIQMMQVGTLVRVTTQRQDGQVLLKLTYEASRLGEPVNEDSPPDVISVQCNTTLAVSPGQTVLAGGMSSGNSTLLLVTVEQ
jgi:type II secretory pathway component GspD/PulD (secretin)